MAQSVKNPTEMQETQVQSITGSRRSPGEGTGYSSILAWKIPWTEEPGGLESMGLRRVEHDLSTKPQPPPRDTNVLPYM